MTETRIAYGARCNWWDDVDQAATNAAGLPVCPICGGVLFEVPSQTLWWGGVKIQEAKEPGYRAMIEWSRGKCFPNIDAVRAAYRQATDET